MRHLSDGMLRRLYDEPLAVPSNARQHVVSCTNCRGRYASIAADASAAQRWLDHDDILLRPDASQALMQVRTRIAGKGNARTAWPLPFRTLPHRRFSTTIAVFAAMLAALILTPAGSLAQNFLSIFQPRQFAAVAISPEDLANLRQLPNLDAYGTMRGIRKLRPLPAASPAEVTARTGLTLHLPSSLPAGVPANVGFVVVPRASASFTFSAARARATASHQPLPPMPARLDGSTLTAAIGPVAVATYGGTLGLRLPLLVIAEGVAPSVSAQGASVAEIENYLLLQPGISPTLAAEIRAIGDPTTTVPIPVPISLATAQNVIVQGVHGLAIGDNTGVGSGVIWEKDGMVYGVAGALAENQILAIANGIH